MVKIGMAKIDLESALQSGIPIREERVEAISLYAESAKQRAVWVVLDFMDFDIGMVTTIRSAVCEKLKMPMEQIHIVTTHNHGGGTPDFDKLGQLAAMCALDAQNKAQPAKMRYAYTTAEHQVSIHRRKPVRELDGVTTLFYGANKEEGFDGAPFTERAIQAIKDGYVCYYGRMDTQRSYDPFESGDKEIVAAEFQALDGTPIGTLLRFAAHAVCSNLSDSFSSDYPWYVRAKMEAHFGGIAVFMNGPCGDIAPEVIKKADGSQCILGEYLADRAIVALEETSFVVLEDFYDEKVKIALPVRKEVRQNKVELQRECPGVDDMPNRRRYLEKEYLEKSLPFLRSKVLEPDGVGEQVEVEFGVLKLNNLWIAAFPGETFWETGNRLKEAFPDTDICTVTEHGRTVMYLPPLWDFERGGYESVCMATQAGAESVLREQAIQKIKEIQAKRV